MTISEAKKQPEHWISSNRAIDVIRRQIEKEKKEGRADELNRLARLREQCVNESCWYIIDQGIRTNWTYDYLQKYAIRVGFAEWFKSEEIPPDHTFQKSMGIPTKLSQWNLLLARAIIGQRHHDKHQAELIEMRSTVEDDAVQRVRLRLVVCELIEDLNLAVENYLIDEFIILAAEDKRLPESSFENGTYGIHIATPHYFIIGFLRTILWLEEDIATIKHEFIHYLKNNATIAHDVYIPIASAVSNLSLSNSNHLYSRGHTVDAQRESENNQLTALLDDLFLSINQIYCIFVLGLPPEEAGDAKYTEQIVIQLQQRDATGVNEPLFTYEMGRRLALLASRHPHPYRFLGALAKGFLPNEAWNWFK